MKSSFKKSHVTLEEAKNTKGKSNWSKLYAEQQKEKNKSKPDKQTANKQDIHLKK